MHQNRVNPHPDVAGRHPLKQGLKLDYWEEDSNTIGSLVIRVTQPDKSCIQRVPLEVKIYALEQMFDV